jgi:nitroimidazol reductase NimA-like FMN-containing flavoprotein (pyridoxamine 5'-phosphate oxidase superfamily)
MATKEPETTLDPRFSSPEASATEWAEGRRRIEDAEVFWLTTVRVDGRPHVTPLISVWRDGAAYFCTGPDEQKARNLAANPAVVLTTGANRLDEGLDVVIEGEARRVTDEASLRELAEAWESKYGNEWHFDVGDGTFRHAEGEALVFEVSPTKVLGFGKGERFSHTRWRFGAAA